MNNQFSFQHETFPGNILIRWMTQKRKGTIKEFVSTLNYLIFNHLGLEEVHEGKIQEEAMYLLDDLASLLLIEYNEKESGKAKPSRVQQVIGEVNHRRGGREGGTHFISRRPRRYSGCTERSVTIRAEIGWGPAFAHANFGAVSFDSM